MDAIKKVVTQHSKELVDTEKQFKEVIDFVEELNSYINQMTELHQTYHLA